MGILSDHEGIGFSGSDPIYYVWPNGLPVLGRYQGSCFRVLLQKVDRVAGE